LSHFAFGVHEYGELKRRRWEIPIVFITAHGDETIGPRLIADGAVACSSRSTRRPCSTRSTPRFGRG